MAKITEGDPYYYAPIDASRNPINYKPDTFEVWYKDSIVPIAKSLNHHWASRVVDALNLTHKNTNETASYMTRHRPICAVLTEIRERAEFDDDTYLIKLVDEALDYARRMSARLTEYKYKENTDGSKEPT